MNVEFHDICQIRAVPFVQHVLPSIGLFANDNHVGCCNIMLQNKHVSTKFGSIYLCDVLLRNDYSSGQNEAWSFPTSCIFCWIYLIETIACKETVRIIQSGKWKQLLTTQRLDIIPIKHFLGLNLKAIKVRIVDRHELCFRWTCDQGRIKIWKSPVCYLDKMSTTAMSPTAATPNEWLRDLFLVIEKTFSKRKYNVLCTLVVC